MFKIQMGISKPLFYITFISFLTVFNSTHTYAQMDKIKEHFKKLEEQNQINPSSVHFIQDDTLFIEDYSKLKQIILLRHGEPALDKKGWRTREEAVQFINDYDSVKVFKPSFSPLQLEDGELYTMCTSCINRSISTADQLFGLAEKHKPDSLFREFERKIFPFFNVKLPLKWWLTGSRVFWFMGLNDKGIESFSEARDRAREGAAYLNDETAVNNKVLLVSHGLLNHYLSKYLEEMGWDKVYDGGKGYLSQKVFMKYEDTEIKELTDNE